MTGMLLSGMVFVPLGWFGKSMSQSMSSSDGGYEYGRSGSGSGSGSGGFSSGLGFGSGFGSGLFSGSGSSSNFGYPAGSLEAESHKTLDQVLHQVRVTQSSVGTPAHIVSEALSVTNSSTPQICSNCKQPCSELHE